MLFLLSLGTSYGQSIVFKILNNDPGLLISIAKDGKSYTIAAAVEKRTHVCYFLSCYGKIVASVDMSDDDYARIEKKEKTPFDYYNASCNYFLDQLFIAQTQLRAKGAIDTTWSFGQFLNKALPTLNTLPNPLRKIMLLDEVKENYLIHQWLINNRNPKDFPEDSSTLYTWQDKVKEGTMTIKGDTTLFYNRDRFAKVYKAMLLSREAKIYYYDRNNTTLDTLPLRPTSIAGLLREKTDVFSLYKGWMEMQLQSLADELKMLDSLGRMQPHSLIQLADNRKSNIDDLILETKESFSDVGKKIVIAAVPDPKAIATAMHLDLQNQNASVFVAPSLGLAYMTTFTRGNKEYELADHRGNVMAVVSDRKPGTDVNGDGIVDYYRPDVVSATDYYPFGGQEPGRAYLAPGGQSFRYGYNGKENDNEVKGVGDQQDYGMRIYDPRVGRFLSVDPITKKYPELTPYQFASNTPIQAIDLDGKEGERSTIGNNLTYEILTKSHVGNKDAIIAQQKVNQMKAAGVLLVGAAAADALLLKGWATKTLLATEAFGAFHDNIARTPEGRAAQNDESKTLLADAFLNYGIGRAMGALSQTVKAIVEDRIVMANKFYIASGFTDDAARASHLNGIDFLNPVEATTLKKGTELIQWTYLDAQGKPKLGNYFTLPGQNPSRLGIPLDGRVMTTIKLTEDTKFLQSTSADIENWLKPGSGEMLQGGGTQLFQTNVKYQVESVGSKPVKQP